MTKEETITAEAAIDRYADMVYRLALSQMKNKTDAEDLFQEVFVRLVSNVEKLESWEHVKAWLIRVTINCAKKHFDLYWNKNVDYIEDEERIRGEEAYEPPPEHPVREAVLKLPQNIGWRYICIIMKSFPWQRLQSRPDKRKAR